MNFNLFPVLATAVDGGLTSKVGGKVAASLLRLTEGLLNDDFQYRCLRNTKTDYIFKSVWSN